MALPKLPTPFLKYFHAACIYLLSALGLLVWHPWINIVLCASGCLLFTAVALSFLPAQKKAYINFRSCITLWVYQGMGVVVSLVFASLWLTQYPYYGFTNHSPLLHHLSFSLFAGTFMLINLLIILVSATKQTDKSPNFSSVYPADRMDWRSLTYIHAIFFQCLKLVSLIFFFLSLITLLPGLPVNMLIFAAVCLICVSLFRSETIYDWLQTAIKRWHWRLSFFLFSMLVFIGVLTAMINWFFYPIYPVSFLNLIKIGADSPLIVLWGCCIFLSAPLSYLIAPKILHCSPRMILIASLCNPLLWLLLFIDYHQNILLMLHAMPLVLIKIIASIGVVTSFVLLGSSAMATLNARFFFTPAYQRQQRMPRVLVKSYLVEACMLMSCFAIHALFWIQIMLLNFSTWMIGIVFLLLYHYFYSRKK